MNSQYIFPSGVTYLLKYFWDCDYMISPSFLPSQPSPFTPPLQTCSLLPVALCLEFRAHDLSILHISMSVGILLLKLLFRQPCWWDFYGCSFTNICRRHNLAANSLTLWLRFFSSSFFFFTMTFPAFFPSNSWLNFYSHFIFIYAWWRGSASF